MVSISNLLGEILLEKKISNIGSRTVELNVASLPSGIYFLRAGNDVCKFVKD
ncbi:hypothetical protein D3C83_203530 [compost metagenome]